MPSWRLYIRWKFWSWKTHSVYLQHNISNIPVCRCAGFWNFLFIGWIISPSNPIISSEEVPVNMATEQGSDRGVTIKYIIIIVLSTIIRRYLKKFLPFHFDFLLAQITSYQGNTCLVWTSSVSIKSTEDNFDCFTHSII